MDTMKVGRKLWEHPDPKSTSLYKFMQSSNEKYNLKIDNFWDLYQWSITKRSDFWSHVLSTSNLIYNGTYTKVVDESARIDSIPKWFEGLQMNFAENLLFSRDKTKTSSTRCTTGKEDNKTVFTEVREGCTEIRDITWKDLRKEVGRLANAMKAHGVGKGDRVMVVMSNSIVTAEIWLAAATIGAIFSSSSTDMGVKGVLQRALQIEPKYIFMDDFAIYNGKKVDLREKMKDISTGMKDVKAYAGVVSVSRFQEPADVSQVSKAILYNKYLDKASSDELKFEQTAFGDPFYIAYSSGTTGTPKCIVHSIGGVLLSAVKETGIQRDIGPNDTVLQYTTTGWIMYLFAVCQILHGARSVLYDGSPFIPDSVRFIKLLEEQKVTLFGTSPRWMGEMQKNKIVPRDVADLSKMRLVTSTGMVLSDQLFEWFYDVGFPKTVHLANISGGTDLAGCFGQENTLTPVYVGGTQGPSLGTPIAVYDSLIEGGRGISGASIPDGEAGELVAHLAFPNMPIHFWNDPSGSRYFSAYFEKYDNVWTHGDFVMLHPVTKQLFFLGRADGVLNPSGVRFGSAEIYAVLENGFPTVSDAICVGQRRPQDADESVMLFLLMKKGEKMTRKLVEQVKSAIRRELSARHVPKYVFETPDIPTTVNLKKVELPVKQIVSGKIIKPSGTLLNPESLDYYYRFAKVEEMVDAKSKL